MILDCIALFSVQTAASSDSCDACVCLCVCYEIGSHVAQDSLKPQDRYGPSLSFPMNSPGSASCGPDYPQLGPSGSASCGLRLQADDITSMGPSWLSLLCAEMTGR